MSAESAEFTFLQDIAAELAQGEIVFPTFITATLKIRTALADADASADRIARTLETEPLVSIAVLKLANSAAQRAGGKPITDVRTAVTRVGIGQVRAAAMAVVMSQLRAERELRGCRPQADAVWRHTVAVAARAKVIAEQSTRLNGDTALFTGIVHDIGYLYLLARAQKHPELNSRQDAVRRIVAEWHPAIGKAVLHGARLAESIGDAVAEHEVPDAPVPPRSMADVIRHANQSTAATNPAGAPSGDCSDVVRDLIRDHADAVRSIEAALRD